MAFEFSEKNLDLQGLPRRCQQGQGRLLLRHCWILRKHHHCSECIFSPFCHSHYCQTWLDLTVVVVPNWHWRQQPYYLQGYLRQHLTVTQTINKQLHIFIHNIKTIYSQKHTLAVDGRESSIKRRKKNNIRGGGSDDPIKIQIKIVTIWQYKVAQTITLLLLSD